MRLLFSESKSDYGHYIFPYAIWAFPEAAETPGDLFHQGFLPSSRDMDRFYLCRQVRIALPKFRPTSENRRIMRKGEGLTATLIPRHDFDYTPQRRTFCKTYADIKFGKDVMGWDRLDGLFEGKITSHVLVFADEKCGADVGLATLYVEDSAMAYYYHAFYDLGYYTRNLGMYMMTWAVESFAARGLDFLYLGSCYLPNALYKVQFAGAEFFNGFRWSSDLKELKFLIRREQQELRQHLLESEEYRESFCDGDLAQLASGSPFRIKIKP